MPRFAACNDGPVSMSQDKNDDGDRVLAARARADSADVTGPVDIDAGAGGAGARAAGQERAH